VIVVGTIDKNFVAKLAKGHGICFYKVKDKNIVFIRETQILRTERIEN